MKFSTAVIIILFITFFSDRVQAQEAKITFDLAESSITRILDEIESITEYKFIYKDKTLENFDPKSFKAENETIKSILDRLFQNANVRYQIIGSQIVLNPKPQEIKQIKHSAKSSDEIIKPTTFQVSGSVYDQDGTPLPSASILEKGTNNGIITDIDGNFTLEVHSGDAVLIVSFVSFIPQEIPVDYRDTLRVVLAEDQTDLEQIIVVGYGTQRKLTLTGAASNIRTKEIQETQTANLANNLVGRIPGLVISSRGGEPGSDNVNIRIRGIGTTGNTDPLYVIDGIPNRGSFERLNPDDIESISVLKDASAAIYGAQAANGVILITTKRGKESKPTFNYNMNYSLAQATRRPKLMNAYQYLTWIDEINERSGRPREFDDIIRQYRFGTIDGSVWGDTDWWDAVTDKWTPQAQHSLSITGGNKTTQYYLSGQYLNQDALYMGNAYGYKQYNIRSNIDTRISDNIKIGFDLSARNGDKNSPTLSTDGLIRQIFVQPPYEFPYFENGLLRKTSVGNPISLVNGDSGSKKTQSKKFDTKFSFRWDLPFITEGLYVLSYATIDYYTTTRKDLSKPFDQFAFDEETGEYLNLKYQTGNISLFQQHSEELNTLIHSRVGYDQSFERHNLSSFIAYEQHKKEGEYIFASRQNLISEDIPFLFSGADENLSNGGRGYQFARQNLFGRINYNYDNKYLLDVTMRYDGSSNFAKGNRFGFFPAASLGWRISKEAFFNSNLIEELKVRGSWGLLGNDRVANFQYLQIYNIGNSYIFGEDPQRTNGLTPGTTPNPNITWETSQKLNLGFDFRLKQRLLEGSIDLFYELRSDILAPRNASVPVYAGLSLPDENIGEVSNRGIEIQLNHQNTINELTYAVGGQFTFAESRIIFIDEPPNVPEWQQRTGRPVDYILLYEADGIYNNQEEIDNSVHFPDAQPGDVRIIDKNGDGMLNEQDKIIIENSPTPRIVYGFPLALEWKNFAMNILIQGQSNAQTLYRPFDINQQSEFYTERWRSELRTPNAQFPAAFNTASSSFREVSTIWLRDNSFLRLKNIELSYSIDPESIKPFGLNSLSFFLSGHNVLILSDKVKINDPESSSSTGWYYPQQRLITGGFRLSF
jgi:TonB-linked SusC/RagA family outer membrane protein